MELLSASHEVLEFVDRDLFFAVGPQRPPTIESCKAVADRISMADVMGDENLTDPFLSYLVDVSENHRCLGDTKAQA